MLSTWTSELSPNDQAFLRVSAYFVLRRGRGSALSSADTDALDSWIRDGYGWMDILQAIDTAFAKLRTPPATIRGCKRYLPKNVLMDELLDPNILAAAFGQTTNAPTLEELEEAVSENCPAEDAIRHLQNAAQATKNPLARDCYLELRTDILERKNEGPISPETIAIFDEALALLALEKLPQHQRDAIEASIDQQPLAMRTRTLLELAGAALELDYPRMGQLHLRAS